MKMRTEQDWQTSSDVDALQRAKEVQSDPKRHARAQEHAAAKLKEHDAQREQLASVAKEKAKKQPASGAARNSQLHAKVKAGLKAAFPNR